MVYNYQKAIGFDINIVFEQLMSEYPIFLDDTDKNRYSKVIKIKQDDIKKYKLIR